MRTNDAQIQERASGNSRDFVHTFKWVPAQSGSIYEQRIQSLFGKIKIHKDFEHPFWKILKNIYGEVDLYIESIQSLFGRIRI